MNLNSLMPNRFYSPCIFSFFFLSVSVALLTLLHFTLFFFFSFEIFEIFLLPLVSDYIHLVQHLQSPCIALAQNLHSTFITLMLLQLLHSTCIELAQHLHSTCIGLAQYFGIVALGSHLKAESFSGLFYLNITNFLL